MSPYLFASEHTVSNSLRIPQLVPRVMEAFDPQSSNLSAYTADVFWHGSLQLPVSLMPRLSTLMCPLTMPHS